MAKVVYHEVMQEHQNRLERIAEKRGVSRLKKIYEESHAEVQSKLQKAIRGGKGQTYTAQEHRIVLAQLTAGQALISQRLTGELTDAAKDAQRDTLHGLSRGISKIEKKLSGSATVLPVEDAARFAGVIDKRHSSLLRRHHDSMKDYGIRTVSKMEGELTKSLLQGESQSQAIDRIVKTADVEFWQAERIVRTELSWASNATQADGIEAARETMPDMMMQWRELVSDAGNPLDNRVGVDSEAMHAQVVVPGTPFTCPRKAPSGEHVPDDLADERVDFPPNRPNDRGVVAPWRRAWGIPGWKYVIGRRVWIVSP